MKSSYTFGVVGHRISYSRSPELFEAIAAIRNFTCHFVVHDLAPESFDTAFPEVLKSGIDGFSVTIPHKTRAIRHMDHIDTAAEKLGVVNSVCVKNGSAYGFNTDGYGFAVPLHEHRAVLRGTVALVVGSGGASKAVVNCLLRDFGAGTIVVLGRSETRLDAFAGSMRVHYGEGKIQTLPLSRFDSIRDIDYGIVVNCTPLGGWNHPDETPFDDNFVWRAGRIYYDLSYNDHNKLVERAAQCGMIAFDGSAMLIGQAIRSFYLWTGESVDFAPVYRAVFGKR